MKPKKSVITVGKKKSATARVKIDKGKGNVRINSVPLDNWGSFLERNLIKEPLALLEGTLKNVDISANVSGGGRLGQAVATRVAVARALVKWTGDEKIRKTLIAYDDKILSGDSRQKEPCKPNRSSARSKRQKSYR